MATPTYLETTRDGQGYFSEVRQDGKLVTWRAGKVGSHGRVTVTTKPTTEKARTYVARRVADLVRKGYAITRPTGKAPRDPDWLADEETCTTTLKAPLVWRFKTTEQGIGLWVDNARCWYGNQRGEVFSLDRDGAMQSRVQLPDDVQSIVADDHWHYAGCSDGYVYDLSGDVPRRAYEIQEGADLNWMDIRDGRLVVSDGLSQVTVVNAEGDRVWRKLSPGVQGWMLRTDDAGVYHGHSQGLTAYDWSGRKRWTRARSERVMFGWRAGETLVTACADGTLRSFTVEGKPGVTCTADTILVSCAASDDGSRLYAADAASALYCFDRAGARLWKLATGCGVAGSLQYHGGRLYLATWDGALGCVDVSNAAIGLALRGKVPRPVNHRPPKGKTPRAARTDTPAHSQVPTTRDSSAGVVLECYLEGARVRVRVVSPGYNPAWHCQFPRDLRQDGARFVVDAVHPARNGEFYRAYGNIRRLVGV